MDIDSLQFCPSNSLDNTNDHLDMPQPQPQPCGLCGRTLSFQHTSFQPVTICDDCKFLLLEDFATPARNSLRTRLPGRRRRRRSITVSADSTENFSREFSQIINQARRIEPDLDDMFGDTDSNITLVQPVSSRTTPSGSRRWRRIFSDTESDGFNSDSFGGEDESNISTSAYRVYHDESDSISFSSYEGDSGASVDDHIYTDIFVQSVERSDTGSDSDIDPMHAGVIHWNFDDRGVEGEWAEVNADENVTRPHNSDYFSEHSRADSYEFEGMIRQRINEVRGLQISSMHMSVEEFDDTSHNGNSGDYLDAREFEELLENLAGNDSARRGAPPAALSSIDNLPLVVISDEHVKPDGLACAICKDFLMIGTEVHQLPCFHLYHPSCILPWLSARNSCPLCRYELPTDDTDYELGKRNANPRVVISEIQMEEDRDGSSSVTSDTREMVELQDVSSRSEGVGPTAGLEHTNYRRGGWLFLAAAPIVSLAGIFFVLWLGNVNSNPLVGQRGINEQRNLHGLSSQPIHTTGSCLHNERVKRWWWWF